MKQLYFSILLGCFAFFSFGQQRQKIDSLKGVLKNVKSKEKKLSTLELLNTILISNSKLEESLPFFLEMGSTAKYLRNDELETRAYKYISEVYMKKMDSTSAFKYARKALEINTNKNNLKGFLLDLNQLGRIYYHFQYYNEALKTYNKGITKYSENLDKDILLLISRLYKNSSITCNKLGLSEKSIEYLLKGIKISEKTGDVDEKSYSLYSLGYMYMDLNNYNKAEEYFLKSLKFSDSVSLQTFTNMNHHGLGINYSRWGKYDDALKHNKIALDFFRKQNDKLYEFDVLNNTAVVYQRMNISDSIIKYGNLALKVAKEINNKMAIKAANITLSDGYLKKNNYRKAEKILLEVAKDTIDKKIISANSKSSIYFKLSEVYEGNKKYKKSLDYYKKFKELNDSINKEILDSKFSDIETKYQTEKKEKELVAQKNATQEQELLTQKANTRNWLLLLGWIAIGIIAFVIWRRYKSETKAKQIINKQKNQIEKLQKEFHHRLKNDFRSINSFISLVQKQFSDNELKERLNELKNRVTSMFKVHEILLQEEDITQVKAHPYLLELSQNVENKYKNENIKLSFNIDKTETIIADKAIPFGIILNEFVTNSYKYAFDKDGGEITIDFKSNKDNHHLTLKDNGKGLPKDFNIDNLRSLGMSIIPMFADLHDGSYQLDGTDGVSLTLTLPKKVA